ncbi:MAG TPA: homoserine O-succinyltransferase [Xanthobacteraceae bacterium]|nr:homoserine O-succinyltransferase [Xanthobacteraceae bacterium]
MPLTVTRDTDLSNSPPSAGGIEIGLVNNMPDTALKSTEAQFAALLTAAAGDLAVRLRLFTLPLVPRSERGAQHLGESYLGLRDFWDSWLDALIVTGTEPRAAALADEPYWPALSEVIEWAEEHTISTVWSCLAAHAAVFHLDGIARQPLADKRFGVFSCDKSNDSAGDHPLIRDLASPFPVPHSRWNELREDDLRAGGYEILTRSAAAGVDMFARQGRSLFVFFQGHPEYDPMSLLGEYRRDLGRYLRRERATCPPLPHGYFDAATSVLLTEFAARAQADRREELLAEFPLAAAEGGVRVGWRDGAAQVYRNWLTFIAARKAEGAGRRAAPPRRLNRPHAARDRNVSFIDRRRRAGPPRPGGPADRRRSADPA